MASVKIDHLLEEDYSVHYEERIEEDEGVDANMAPIFF
ncbi:hypothetical protein DFA_00078 [Cavenderia fasciculata]|uniref:Uncharacterized protein n=1 Tax=Cavenderia fasciculata TaxID=261658 RepID=F4PXJ0_CACFS|nr:uncharacterized protein DFA_00078 [Cavenderia fasciculata]EGG19500.1 hypothetical protein DFA_00078 [Cavenderia fasciculata]|eukprot:XP_004357794.1 hypothetical protein DFA_00078 [Cavenderia fasciculata]